jgi:hypothetical protein
MGMNEFTSALSGALHEEAKEIAMSADLQRAERQLQESIRSVDRRRRVWVAVAAAAAILVVAAGITLGVKPEAAPPTRPVPTTTSRSPEPVAVQADHLTPPLTVQLPHWVASADPRYYANGYHYDQHDGDRAITLFSVGYMYPLDATEIAHPGYAALVADWKAVQTQGYGTVSDVATTTVDGRPATTMTARLSRGADGFAYCQSATDVRTDPDTCTAVYPGRTYHLAIVDQGPAEPPTLVWESSTTDFTSNATRSRAAIAAELGTWLATIRFR